MRLLAILALVAGCHMSPEQRERDVCTAYCDCVVSPGMVETCITDDCIPALLPSVTDDCLDCVYMNSQTCSTLFNDCSDLCLDTSTPHLGGI